jgi:energy-coupling factor transport system permease protein
MSGRWRDHVHPWAWWVWAIGVAVAASLTTNPLLLGAILVCTTAVVLLRRPDDPWARSVSAYFALAGAVLAIRLVFTIAMGAATGSTVVFRLPELPLPAWAAGIRIGGPVTLEGLLYTVYDSLRLVAMLVAFGAANALSNPRRALRSVPAALSEASVAAVVALTVAPQLIESTQRVRRARRLRGGRSTGLSAVTGVVIPVFADAVDRSLCLASGMEARGFGATRTTRRPPGLNVALIGAPLVACLGAFLLLGTGSTGVGAALLLGGTLGTFAALRLSGRELRATRYRPDPWGVSGWALAGASALTVSAAGWLSAYAHTDAAPSTDPAVWPGVHPAMLVVMAGILAPLALTAPSWSVHDQA